MTDTEFEAFLEKKAGGSKLKNGRLDLKFNPLECCLDINIPFRPPAKTEEERLERAESLARMVWCCDCPGCMMAVYAMALLRHRTKRVDLRFNPLCQDEDFFIPVREGPWRKPVASTKEEIDYIRTRMAAALKVPKDMLYPD